jgi:lipid II:glycine glycyltransferase (peptidoglycan interpeptide bridge formation enzyme)
MTLARLTPAADLSVCDASRSFLQSAFWGEFKSRFAWKPFAFTTEWRLREEALTTPLLVLWKPLIPGVSLAYIPWGPETFVEQELTTEDRFAFFPALACLAVAVKPYLPRSTAFIRFDPPCLGTYPNGGGGGAPLIRAPANVQPADTVLINLQDSEEEILSQMKSKWRYNIRLAERKVDVRQADEAELPVFYRLFRETAQRDGISLHSFAYYQKLFELARERGVALRLYLADYEREPLAAIITLFMRGAGTYLYGASSNNHRNMMAPYALQWRAMRDAKAAGCTAYDLFGIPPDASPTHPMAGLYRFKTGFGGTIIHRPGSWDYPLKPLLYTALGGFSPRKPRSQSKPPKPATGGFSPCKRR